MRKGAVPPAHCRDTPVTVGLTRKALKGGGGVSVAKVLEKEVVTRSPDGIS